MITKIADIASAFPDHCLTNDTLENEYQKWSAEKIYKKTGIRTRRCAIHELSSDLAVNAAEALFKKSRILKNDVDFLLLCTQSPDYFLPSTSALVQDRVGLPHDMGALDFNLGCSGFVYGLAFAKGLIEGGCAKNVLLITSETYTKHINARDKSTRTIFGDGAAATLLCAESSEGFGIGEFVFGTDGKGAKNLIVPAGGMALPKSSETAVETVDDSGNIRSLDNLFMDGPAVFNFTMDRVPQAVEETLKKNALLKEEIALYVFHQANRFMLETLRDKLALPEERFYINMEEKGNTVSATIPIALEDACGEGRLRKGDKVLLAGFGVGYSWAACVLEW